MSKIIANQIQAIGGSALTLPTTHPSSDSNLKVSTSGVISYDAAGGGGSTDSRVFCGAVDFRQDSGVGSSVTISKPADLTASEIRAYEINWYGVQTSSTTSYNMRFKPYKSGSSVMSGNNWSGNMFYSYSSGSYSGTTHNWSSYLCPGYWGGNSMPYRNNGNIQTRDGDGYSGGFDAQVVYNNNYKNASFSYQCFGRYTSSSNYHYHEMGMFSAGGNATTSDYTEQFYFYPGNGTYEEGVISVYAIKK
jgi:hypothetical protein